MKLLKTFLLVVTASLFFAGCSQETKEVTYEKSDKNIDHIHGIGFLDSDLYIATHTGIMKHDGESWYSTTGNNHDYMGFSLTKNGFYSSGHPSKKSNLKNPLGLIKSNDMGKTLEQLEFYGESDFHYLTAGFDTDAIYVINEQPNSKIDKGLYYTTDEGVTWRKSDFSGIQTDAIGNIAAHPNKEMVLVVSTKDGLYLSNDYGNNFELITDSLMVPTVFLLNDEMLYSTIENGRIHLYSQKTNEKNATEFSIPEIQAENPILFVAASHEKPDQLAIITYANDIYVTEDRGSNWKKIASEGSIH